MTLLITGGTGFLGSYLAGHVAREHPAEKVVIFEKFPVSPHRAGARPRDGGRS